MKTCQREAVLNEQLPVSFFLGLRLFRNRQQTPCDFRRIIYIIIIFFFVERYGWSDAIPAIVSSSVYSSSQPELRIFPPFSSFFSTSATKCFLCS